MEHQWTEFVTLCDMNDYTKYVHLLFTVIQMIIPTKYGNYVGRLHSDIFVSLSTCMEVSINLSCLFVHEPPYQTWSISKLNSLLTVTRNTIFSTCMEVSVSLSCLFVHEPPYRTVVVCCNHIFHRSSLCMNHHTKFPIAWGSLRLTPIAFSWM